VVSLTGFPTSPCRRPGTAVPGFHIPCLRHWRECRANSPDSRSIAAAVNDKLHHLLILGPKRELPRNVLRTWRPISWSHLQRRVSLSLFSFAKRYDVGTLCHESLAIAESSHPPVKSRFALQDLNHLGAAVQWHNNVISAARSRKRETASATPTTSPSGAGTSICVRCTPRSMGRESGSASARPVCAAVKL
jgi:hypothetical protein